MPRRTPRRAYEDPRYRRARDQLKRRGEPCWRCGHDIDPKLRWPHPLSWSADHIVPKALLAPDDPRNWHISNLRPAHLRCNEARGKKIFTPSPLNW